MYDESNTFIFGPLRTPTHEELSAIANVRRRDPKSVNVLLISEPRARQEEIRKYLEILLGDERINVMAKIRPGEDQMYVSGVSSNLINRLHLIRGGSVYEAFSQADVVLGTYSTALYEAVLALCPVVVLNTTFTYGHEIVYDGLAEFAESPANIIETVLRTVELPNEELLRRRNVAWGEEILDGASTLFDVAEIELWGK